ncbi:mycofactocin precursor MftA [Nocardia sp. NBC_01388]
MNDESTHTSLEQSAADVIVEEVLVEAVSIDGMCGVY